MRSLFLLAPWMGQSLGTPMPAYIVGLERTAVDVVRLIPILERTVPINLRWIFRHCFSLKQVAPRGQENLDKIIDIKPIRFFS